MIIEVEDLNKVFQHAVKKPGLVGALKHIVTREYVSKEAVKDVNLTISEGEVIAYVGPNGAGKSTTIKMMTGILQPPSGRVRGCGIELYKKRLLDKGLGAKIMWFVPIVSAYSVYLSIKLFHKGLTLYESGGN